jgi:hypothetical protein
MADLELSRSQILGFRRWVGSVDERLPAGTESLRPAAWAGLQDSMPRAALLSIHARVEGTGERTWEHPSLVQLWGPRFNDYVVAAKDLPAFSLGRLREDARRRAMPGSITCTPRGNRPRSSDATAASCGSETTTRKWRSNGRSRWRPTGHSRHPGLWGRGCNSRRSLRQDSGPRFPAEQRRAPPELRTVRSELYGVLGTPPFASRNWDAGRRGIWLEYIE